MKAIGAAQDFEGHGMVDPEGGSKPMGGVGTSVPTNEAAKDRRAVETAWRGPQTNERLRSFAKTPKGRTIP
jgi:hypothetical protein